MTHVGKPSFPPKCYNTCLFSSCIINEAGVKQENDELLDSSLETSSQRSLRQHHWGLCAFNVLILEK